MSFGDRRMDDALDRWLTTEPEDELPEDDDDEQQRRIDAREQALMTEHYDGSFRE